MIGKTSPLVYVKNVKNSHTPLNEMKWFLFLGKKYKTGISVDFSPAY